VRIPFLISLVMVAIAIYIGFQRQEERDLPGNSRRRSGHHQYRWREAFLSENLKYS